MKKQQGFTLIELLVVVAIIGILATVVLASLGSARSRARDAAAKAALSQARAEAELHASGSTTGYTGICTDSTGAIDKFMDEAAEQAGTVQCFDSANAYAADVVLNDGTIFCVDSTGYAGIPDTTSPYATTIASADFEC